MKTKNSKPIPRGKIKAVKELSELIKTKKTILIADISSIPGSQFQKIGKKLRESAIVKVPKKNLFFRAVDESKKEGVENLKNYFDKPVAILFSDLDSYDLAGQLIKNKSPSKAKSGQIAPTDLEIPAGPTDLVPGPAISELGALGIQIQIQGGKIEIKAPKVVTKKGDKISDGAAAMLSKLGIMPFKIGFTPISSYDSERKIVYANIKIDEEGAINNIKDSFGRALALAISLSYFNSETITHILRKANSHERRLIKIISGEPDEVPQEVANEISPQKKEEKPVNAAEGLASLFG
ncbi:50S ribosomal protein L10 [Candidatus Pacearchaeota archaeon CG10_big_fil_rev_8_21_14_0_10_32_42]|nr:MAG: 50S ribosomal protein L10 [Candidatus Pacearchaeota archaeon CG10_big_fil_rev_8_21_14_0_10_32_42]